VRILYFVEQSRQILAGEFPFKGLGNLLIVGLKIHQVLFEIF